MQELAQAFSQEQHRQLLAQTVALREQLCATEQRLEASQTAQAAGASALSLLAGEWALLGADLQLLATRAGVATSGASSFLDAPDHSLTLAQLLLPATAPRCSTRSWRTCFPRSL